MVDATEATMAPQPEEAEKPKVPLKRLPKPDKEAHKLQMDKLSEKIDAEMKKVDELKELLDNKQNNRGATSSEEQKIRDAMRQCRAKKEDLIAEKQQLVALAKSQREMEREMKEQTRALRAATGHISAKTIDEEIAKLEARIAHESLDLNEEKRVLTQIKDLRAHKVRVAEHDEKISQAAKAPEGASVDERIKEMNAAIDAQTKELADLREALAEAQERARAAGADFPSLLKKKNEALEVAKLLKQEKYKLNQSYKARQDEWWAAEQYFREKERKERHERYLERQAAREQRDKERRAQEMASRGPPLAAEIAACDQLATYILKFDPAAGGKPAQENQSPEKGGEGGASFAGFGAAIKSKREDDLLGGFGGSGKGKKGKKGKGGEDAGPKGSDKLQHGIDVLKDFQKVGVSAPLTRGEVAAKVAQLQERKAALLEKQAKEIKKQEAKEAAEAAAQAKAEAEGRAGRVAAVTLECNGAAVTVSITAVGAAAAQ
ncbi:unnamed protein product [Pedinophyceae sp. YPF-701]|nr:unnamed protein product [Pedinophyceae sp. YPF-701]